MLQIDSKGEIDLSGLTPQGLDELEQAARALLYATGELPKFSYEGFHCFYWALFGREWPEHVDTWAQKFFDAYAAGKRRFLVKAFRGSTKSTVFTIALNLYYLAEFPTYGTLTVQKSDDAAGKTSRQMADIIANNTGWKTMCPNLVPDAIWGANGYEIKNATMDYSKWRESVLKDRTKDPSFIALGWSSGSIVGMHPRALFIDDIHDEEDTRSVREVAAVMATLQSNILQTLNRPPGDNFEPLVVVSYTPWTSFDCYAFLESAGNYVLIETPLYWETDDDDPLGFEYENKWVRLAWGKSVKNPVEYIENKKVEINSSINFARMMLLDLALAESKAPLRYYTYAADAIDPMWVFVGGADPVNTSPQTSENSTSYFALAYVAKIPQGGAVVVDGILKQCSEVEAENYMLTAQSTHPNWQYTAVENVGGGALFIQVLRRNPYLRIVDSDVSGMAKKAGRIKSKKDRILLEMAPWFENGTVRISDADTPFLRALRRLFTNFHSLNPHDDLSFDAGDAVYHALKAMPDVLRIAPVGGTLPGLNKPKAADPFLFGRLS